MFISELIMNRAQAQPKTSTRMTVFSNKHSYFANIGVFAPHKSSATIWGVIQKPLQKVGITLDFINHIDLALTCKAGKVFFHLFDIARNLYAKLFLRVLHGTREGGAGPQNPARPEPRRVNTTTSPVLA